MDEKKKKSRQKLWRRILAVVCVIALIVSMFAFLSDLSIEEEDGIGAEELAKYDEFVNSSPAERAISAAAAYLNGNEDLDSYYQQASVDIGKANYADALVSIEKCLELCAEDENAEVELLDDLWLKYSCIQAVLGAYDEALKGFENLSDGSAYDAERELISAQIALEQGEMDGAYQHLAAYTTLAPDDTSVYALFADACYYTQRYDDANAWYVKAREAGTAFDPSEYLIWGLSLMETNAMYGAVEKFDLAVENGYEDVGLCRSQAAICCYMRGDYEEAVAYGTQALETDSETVDFGMLVFYMGLSVFSLEQYEAAVQYFDTAESLGCAEGELWFYRAFGKMMQDDPQGAADDFTVSATYEALTDSSLLYRAICRLQMEELEPALEDLAQAAASEDESVRASANDLIAQLSGEAGETYETGEAGEIVEAGETPAA